MDEKRTERFTVNLTPAELAKLDAYAEGHRWSRSTAVADLIERGLHHAPSWDYPDPVEASEPRTIRNAELRSYGPDMHGMGSFGFTQDDPATGGTGVTPAG